MRLRSTITYSNQGVKLGDAVFEYNHGTSLYTILRFASISQDVAIAKFWLPLLADIMSIEGVCPWTGRNLQNEIKKPMRIKDYWTLCLPDNNTKRLIIDCYKAE